MATNQDSLNPHLDVSPAPLGPNRGRPRTGQVPDVQPNTQFRGAAADRDRLPTIGRDPVDDADDAALIGDPSAQFRGTPGGIFPTMLPAHTVIGDEPNGQDPEVKFRGPSGP